MKRIVTYLILGIALIVFGCEKDNNEGPSESLKLTKYGDDPSLAEPWKRFEYNSEGLLVTVYGKGTYANNFEIEYDSQKRPNKIMRKGYYPSDDKTYDITWTNDGFTSDGVSYSIDSKQRLTVMSEGNTSVNFTYTGDQSAKIQMFYSGDLEETLNITFSEVFCPLSGINIAIKAITYLGYIDLWDHIIYTNYVVESFEFIDASNTDHNFTKDILITVNDDNFPKHIIDGDNDYSRDYVYFDYEKID